MGELDAPGAHPHRELDEFFGAVEILPVDHGIDGERQAGLDHLLRDFQLLAMTAAVAGDAVGIFGIDVLQRQLHVIEPGLPESHQTVTIEQDARGDQIAVEALRPALRDDVGEIRPRRRLAPRQVNLQHAECGGLAQHAFPGFRVEFARFAVELQRIGAIGALQRTAMGQLGEQSDRLIEGHRTTKCLAARSPSISFTSATISERSAW